MYVEAKCRQLPWAEVTEEQNADGNRKMPGGKEKENHVLLWGSEPHWISNSISLTHGKRLDKEVWKKNIGLGDWILPFPGQRFTPYETGGKDLHAEEAKALWKLKCMKKRKKGWQKGSPWSRRNQI